jgi:hypothetical protein
MCFSFGKSDHLSNKRPPYDSNLPHATPEQRLGFRATYTREVDWFSVIMARKAKTFRNRAPRSAGPPRGPTERVALGTPISPTTRMERFILRNRVGRRKRGIFSSREVLQKSKLGRSNAVVAHMDVGISFSTMRGSETVDAFVIRDTGSPVSIIKRSFVPQGCPTQPYTGRALYWGQLGRVRASGCVEGRIVWTANTAAPVRRIVVDDTELPGHDGHDDALLGNDVLWRSVSY